MLPTDDRPRCPGTIDKLNHISIAADQTRNKTPIWTRRDWVRGSTCLVFQIAAGCAQRVEDATPISEFNGLRGVWCDGEQSIGNWGPLLLRAWASCRQSLPQPGLSHAVTRSRRQLGCFSSPPKLAPPSVLLLLIVRILPDLRAAFWWCSQAESPEPLRPYQPQIARSTTDARSLA